MRRNQQDYLLSPNTGPAQLQQFGGVFPNANYMVSQNLLTPDPTPNGAGLASRDAASLAVVQKWLADPRFVAVRPKLETINTRLSRFVAQEQGH